MDGNKYNGMYFLFIYLVGLLTPLKANPTSIIGNYKGPTGKEQKRQIQDKVSGRTVKKPYYATQSCEFQEHKVEINTNLHELIQIYIKDK